MPYRVQFVGLVCFLRERGSRNVLLPDGREPGDGIEPHDASISVDPRAIEDAQGWNAASVSSGDFVLDDPCSIVIDNAHVAGTLDTSAHDNRLPDLRGIDPAFAVDPATAQTIARLEIRQGTLGVYRIPGGTALISQLDVQHDGPIAITVTPAGGGPGRTIRLKPGTEIAITNTGRGGYKRLQTDDESSHFRIYRKLTMRTVDLTEPPTILGEAPPSPSTHRFFKRIGAIGLSTSCSNTGCCSQLP